MSDHPSLIAAFERLDVPEEMRALIIAHHSEPHRHYHTLRHIDLMLRQLPDAHACSREMIAATLFHDIVYDPTRTDNEEMSLAQFESAEWKFGPLDASLVSAMINATKSHHFRDNHSPGDEAINLLLKADLSILWHFDPAVYAWYAGGIRKEFHFVPEDQFRAARSRILAGLRDDLLASGQLTAAEAETLKRNVGWELQLLISG